MLSINEKINYGGKGEFLVISLNEDGFMLKDKTSIFIFHKTEAKKFENIGKAASRLSKEFDTGNQNMYIVREQIKAFIEELLKYGAMMMRR